MKGFTLRCDICSEEVDVKRLIDAYMVQPPKEDLAIRLDVNHDGAIEKINCIVCGNILNLE